MSLEMKKKGKRIKRVNGEIPLPEEVIQHIQSFMSGKEAARTTILSKSWYNAWLTRPTIAIDSRDFGNRSQSFEEFVNKTMQRYQNLSLKIDGFRLSSCGTQTWGRDWIASSHNLIVGAMKMGATAVQLEHYNFPFLQEVFGSKTLLKLSLIRSKINVNYVISCSMLKSLTLEEAVISYDAFKGLVSCCIWMEELSLSKSHGFLMNQLFEFHKLRRLVLQHVDVGSMCSSNFSSRLPCLKDLSILQCSGCKNIQIASTSLETVCFETNRASEGAKYDVPNIRKFTYSCFGLPSHLSINGASKEWEFDISVSSKRFHKTSWFINLKKLLKKFSLSRISLYVCLSSKTWLSFEREHEVDARVVPNALAIEQLMINAPPNFFSALVVRSLGVFRPKFITHPPPPGRCYAWVLDRSSDIFRKRLIRELFISNWEDMFGQFGLNKVNVEMYDKFDRAWRPPQLKKARADSDVKVRLQLIWDD